MTNELTLSKYHGSGNDFVVVLDLDDERELDAATAVALCDRRFGIGADGTVRVTRREGSGFFMDHRNADGSRAAMCGNGIRCAGALLHGRGLVTGTEFDVWTAAGPRHLTLDVRGDDVVVSVDMGEPRFERAAIPMRGPAWETFLGEPFDIGELAVKATALSMGNPHLVLFVDQDPDRYHVAHIGPALEHHELFPERTNVEFVAARDDELKVRVWERGVGETMACGTGACAALVAANEAGLAGRQAIVRFPGGPVEVQRLDDGNVVLTGPATHVFDAVVDLGRLSSGPVRL